MNIRFNASIIAIASCLLASPAWAANDEDEINSYVSINGGVTKAAHACSNTVWVSAGTPCSENYSGYRLAYGYQFTPVWGMELSYGDFGYAEAKSAATFVDPATLLPFTGQYAWSLKAVGWAAFGTATINLGKHFALFGKLGGARPEFREEMIVHNLANGAAYYGAPTAGGAETHLAYGGGMQVNFTQTVALRVQYEWFGKYGVYNMYGQNFPKVGFSMGSLGLVYKF